MCVCVCVCVNSLAKENSLKNRFYSNVIWARGIFSKNSSYLVNFIRIVRLARIVCLQRGNINLIDFYFDYQWSDCEKSD